MRQIHAIIDLQFGSTGKGLLAGYLAKRVRPDSIVTAWGPNAGHTFVHTVNGKEEKMVNIALPNGIVADSVKRVFIGPGSVINPELLMTELERYADYMDNIELVIHENAAVVLERHREAEAMYGFKIGSTMKGVGEANIEKIRRYTYAPWEEVKGARLINIASDQFGARLGQYVASHETYIKKLSESEVLQIEGAQGYSLGINSGFYPYVTSRDCTISQVLSDCGVPLGLGWNTRVHGVCRTFPIRVANRYDANGGQIGWSGPCYPDQREIEWSQIERAPELTTVTKLPRRLFTFSEEQIRQACLMSAVDDIFINFCNYHMAGTDTALLRDVVDKYARVKWLGYGPHENDVKEVF